MGIDHGSDIQIDAGQDSLYECYVDLVTFGILGRETRQSERALVRAKVEGFCRFWKIREKYETKDSNWERHNATNEEGLGCEVQRQISLSSFQNCEKTNTYPSPSLQALMAIKSVPNSRHHDT